MTGLCKFCCCSEGDACTLPDGDSCSWFDRERTICTSPGCLRAAFAERDKQEAAKKKASRKRSPGAIHELMKQERNAKRRARRKGKAA